MLKAMLIDLAMRAPTHVELPVLGLVGDFREPRVDGSAGLDDFTPQIATTFTDSMTFRM
jgi:hypothetical protein